MKNNTINYPYIEPKRVKSVLKPRTSFTLTINNTINSNIASNEYNSLNKENLSKIDIQRLQPDYSIIPRLEKEKVKSNQKRIFKNRTLSVNQKRKSDYLKDPESKKILIFLKFSRIL